MNVIMKRRNVFVLIELLLLSGTALWLLSMILDTDQSNDNWETFQASLKEKEAVIDAVIDSDTAYAITSSTGRSDYGDTLVIFLRKDADAWERIYDNDFKNLKPWRIDFADIDGDEENEIITAVCKSVHFDKTEKNRLFVFNFIQGKLVKKWTGSEIAGTWENFAVGDFAPMEGNEIVFIQKTESGEQISVYYWSYFGFLLLAQSNEYKDITDITVIGENRITIAYMEGRKVRQQTLEAQEGNLVGTES